MQQLQLYAGTSGFSYTPWRGHFYPEKLQPSDFLSYYATKLNTVELNATFYRMPKAETVQRWAQAVPDSFRFAVKASRRMTHQKRLADCEEALSFLIHGLEPMWDRLGAVLFQLPPNFRANYDRLGLFLSQLPSGLCAAFEFRHPSWLEGSTETLLRNHNAAWVWVDGEDWGQHLCATADFGYVRLRAADYSPADLSHWVEQLHQPQWKSAAVFFKHEDAGMGPALAQQLARMWQS